MALKAVNCWMTSSSVTLLMMMIANLTTAAVGITCAHNISVSTSNGTNNTSTCWHDPLYPCFQLDDALDAIDHFNRTQVCITVLTDVTLSKPITLKNTSDVIISGAVYQLTVNCSGRGGLSFLQSVNICISNLIFDKCLMKHNSTSFFSSNQPPLQFYSALYFSCCNDIGMIGVDVRNSNATGVTMYDVNGYVDVSNCNLYANMPHNGIGGGGLYIEFTFVNPDGCAMSANTPAKYFIYKCTFTDNTANISNDNSTLFIRPVNTTHLSFSRGGGISVYFKGRAQYKSISITKCTVANNHAYWGAGIFAEFQDYSSHNRFVVDSTNILNNVSPQLDKNSGTGGGGVRTGFIFYEPNTVHNNTIVFTGSEISYNKAYWGGGVSFRTCPEQGVVHASNTISFTKCDLIHNTARLGSAIDLTIWHGLPAGVFSTIIFTTCTFQYNSISYVMEDIKLLGKGALYIDTLPVKFTGNNTFKGNDGSAVAAVASSMEFCDISVFTNNTGDKGGAIALLGGSWIIINENANLSFFDNVATDKGGAIYVMTIGEHDLISSRNCFIRYYDPSKSLADWNTSLYFADNEAGVAGDSIYVTTLLPCIWTASNASSYNLSEAMKDLFSKHPFTYNHSSKSGNYKDIATAASHFNYNNTPSVFPGQLKQLSIGITDDKGNDASAYTNFVVVASNDSSVTVDNKYISSQMIRLYGKPNSSVNLTLQTTSTTAYSVNLPVSVSHCPPGLCLTNGTIKTNGTTCSCHCGHRAYQGVATCDSKQYYSTISPLFWAGYVDDDHLGDDQYFVTTYCPSGYCNTTDRLFTNFMELDKYLCQPQNRTGFLCGRCLNDMSVYSSSIVSRCGECSNFQHGKYFGLLQFTFYEVIPLIVFFLFLVVFNFSLTSGPLNGFIFFSQVISSLAAYNHQFTVHSKSILLFYSIWNLDFLEVVLDPYCLMKGWNTLDVFAFHYVSAVLPLILILLVVVLMNYGRRMCFPLIYFTELLRNSLSHVLPFKDCKCTTFLVALKHNIFNPYSKVLHGLTAVLVLSYAKFVSISFLLLEPSLSLSGNWPSNINNTNHLRVLLNGSLVYFGTVHIKYAIPAVMVIIISILPPLVLLCRPILHRCGRLEQRIRRWLPLTKIDLFLNEFYSCYRPKCQWYASLYFFYRILLYFASCFTLLNQQYILQQLLCTMFLVIHSVVQPYTSRLHNCIDAIILAVLLALSCLQEQSFFVSHGIIEDRWPSGVIGSILACIPLLYLLVYVAVAIVRRCYAAYKDIDLVDGTTEDDFIELEEERQQLFERSDMLHGSSHNLQEHNHLVASYQPLGSMTDDNTPDSINNASQVSSKYGTLSDQPD